MNGTEVDQTAEVGWDRAVMSREKVGRKGNKRGLFG